MCHPHFLHSCGSNCLSGIGNQVRKCSQRQRLRPALVSARFDSLAVVRLLRDMAVLEHPRRRWIVHCPRQAARQDEEQRLPHAVRHCTPAAAVARDMLLDDIVLTGVDDSHARSAGPVLLLHHVHAHRTCLHAVSLATLMSRPSIARELAVAQGVTGPQGREIDELAASQVTPVTLARPVIRRLMKKEQRRAHGDCSIKMNTEVHQMQSKCDDLAPCLEEEPWAVDDNDHDGGSNTTMGDSNLELGLGNSKPKSDAAETRSINSLAPFTSTDAAVPAALTSILSPPANISQHPPTTTTTANLNRPLPPNCGITPRGRIVRVASPIPASPEDEENEKA